MKLVKFMMIAAITTLTVGSAMSQEVKDRKTMKSERMEKSPEQKAERLTKRMTEELGLSDVQAAKVKKLNYDHAIREKMDREARKSRRDDHQAKLRAVLTPEQGERFEAKMNDRKNKRKHKKGMRKKRKKAERLENGIDQSQQMDDNG